MPLVSPFRGLLVVAETENVNSENSCIILRTSVVFPEPDGAENMMVFPGVSIIVQEEEKFVS